MTDRSVPQGCKRRRPGYPARHDPQGCTFRAKKNNGVQMAGPLTDSERRRLEDELSSGWIRRERRSRSAAPGRPCSNLKCWTRRESGWSN